MIPAIVFDLDGTLVDSAPDLQYSTNILMDEMDLPSLDLPTVTSFIGHGVGPLVKAALAHNGVAKQGRDLQKSIDRFSKIYSENPARFCKPFDGVIAVLDELKRRGYKLAICTNKSEHLAKLVVEAVGLNRYCPVLIGGDSLPLRKPDPSPLYECVRQLGSQYCLYVGDSETDSLTAKNADVPFFLHTKGYRKTPISKLYHTKKYDKWQEFIPLIESVKL